MVAAGFGWSAGDIVQAIKILCTIIESFNEAKGASKQHAQSTAFLLQLVAVLRRMRDQYTDASNSQQFRQDIEEQYDAVQNAYTIFYNHLLRKYKLLIPTDANGTVVNSSKRVDVHRLKQMLGSVRWSLEEMHQKVLELRSSIAHALVTYNALMLQITHDKVDSMREDYGKVVFSTRQSSERMEALGQQFLEIQEQIRFLEEARRVYEDSQSATSADQRTSQIANHQASMQSIENVKTDLMESLQITQKELISVRQDIAAVIGAQENLMRGNREEGAKWEQLRVQAESAPNDFGNNLFGALTETATGGQHVVQGLAHLTKNKEIKEVAERWGGIDPVLEGLQRISRPTLAMFRRMRSAPAVTGVPGQETSMGQSLAQGRMPSLDSNRDYEGAADGHALSSSLSQPENAPSRTQRLFSPFTAVRERATNLARSTRPEQRAHSTSRSIGAEIDLLGPLDDITDHADPGTSETAESQDRPLLRARTPTPTTFQVRHLSTPPSATLSVSSNPPARNPPPIPSSLALRDSQAVGHRSSPSLGTGGFPSLIGGNAGQAATATAWSRRSSQTSFVDATSTSSRRNDAGNVVQTAPVVLTANHDADDDNPPQMSVSQLRARFAAGGK